jgi:hypothetical protein
MTWRVQATWTVDGAQKSYAPQFARTRVGAARVKRQMEKTLGHFPTLEVVVETVPAEEAAIQPGSVGPPEPLHLIESQGATTTACGLHTAEVRAVAVADIFVMSGTQCASCAGRARA